MYEVHKLTGADLVDASGRAYGGESAGVVSRHRTREAAERALAELRKTCPGNRYQVRAKGGDS